MKKFYIILITIIFCLSLSGCGVGDYKEVDSLSLVSAIGFDNSVPNIRITVEIADTSKSEDEKNTKKLFSAEAKSADEALNRILGETAKQLNFSHLGAIILGEGLSRAQIEEIFCF